MSAVAAPKTVKVCPISRSDFDTSAEPLDVTVAGMTLQGTPKQFSTGSMGWNINAKINVRINGVVVPCQVGMNITAIGSKELL